MKVEWDNRDDNYWMRLVRKKHIVNSGYNAVTLLWKLHKDKGNNKITELRTILQRESQNS